MTRKKCKNCHACKRLYRENLFYFSRFKGYYCTKHDEMISVNDSCEDWGAKRPEYDFSKERFEQIESDLKILIERIKKIESQ